MESLYQFQEWIIHLSPIAGFLQQLQVWMLHTSPITLHSMILGFFIGAALILLSLALWMTRKKKISNNKLSDFESIAGDDVVTTQLDLAKAYLEMDKADAAKKILKQVIKKGSKQQKKEAKQLILETT